jgi:predicted RNA-binding protein YlxR (DUF448 family)
MTAFPHTPEPSLPAKAGDPVPTDRVSAVPGGPTFAGHDEEGDRGPRSGGTERFCVVARAAKPVDELIRFVAGPDGTLVPDIKRKLPGRGVWVTATRSALEKAVKRGAFARGLKESIRIPVGLLDLVDRLLTRAALDALAMANKGGRVAAGFERVDSAISSGRLVALIHAAEASPDGVRKLSGTQAGRPFPLVRMFTASQLGLALGRPSVVHAALLGGREGDSFLARWRTLERYRANEDGDEPTRAGTETVQPHAASELGTE